MRSNERRHDKADGVIDQESRQHAGRSNYHHDQQHEGAVRVLDRDGAGRRKANWPETFRCATTIIMPSNSVMVSKFDRAVGILEIEHAQADHEAGAEKRRAGAIEPVTGQSADGHDDVSRGEDGDGEHGWLC